MSKEAAACQFGVDAYRIRVTSPRGRLGLPCSPSKYDLHQPVPTAV